MSNKRPPERKYMPIPDFQSIMRPLLEEHQDGKEHLNRDLVAQLLLQSLRPLTEIQKDEFEKTPDFHKRVCDATHEALTVPANRAVTIAAPLDSEYDISVRYSADTRVSSPPRKRSRASARQTQATKTTTPAQRVGGTLHGVLFIPTRMTRIVLTDRTW